MRHCARTGPRRPGPPARPGDPACPAAARPDRLPDRRPGGPRGAGPVPLAPAHAAARPTPGRRRLAATLLLLAATKVNITSTSKLSCIVFPKVN